MFEQIAFFALVLFYLLTAVWLLGKWARLYVRERPAAKSWPQVFWNAAKNTVVDSAIPIVALTPFAAALAYQTYKWLGLL
jgi:Na+-transporting methylmalonyl-CoA/oxaloacetate decarboxylase gamma subunit